MLAKIFNKQVDGHTVDYLEVSVGEHLFDGGKTVETVRHESTERRMSFTDQFERRSICIISAPHLFTALYQSLISCFKNLLLKYQNSPHGQRSTTQSLLTRIPSSYINFSSTVPIVFAWTNRHTYTDRQTSALPARLLHR